MSPQSVEARVAVLEAQRVADRGLLEKIDKNVESLIETRTFQRGIIKTVAWVAGSATVIVNAIVWLVGWLRTPSN